MKTRRQALGLFVLTLSLLPFKTVADNQSRYNPEDYVPQAPNVATMQAYVDRPVTLFNGTAQVSIPLCEVNAMGINLPISLSYSSTGFRPSQEATWVGLGWSLSLNACVSRNIKQMNDFQPTYGYFEHGKYIPVDVDAYYLKKAGMIELRSNVGSLYDYPVSPYDLEPDIFSYSIWNKGGKFVLDNQDKENCRMFDIAEGWKMKLCPAMNPNGRLFVGYRAVVENSYNFELISPDGTHYYFKDQEGTLSQLKCVDFSDDAYTSSWFLSHIETKEGQVINFLYDDEYYLSPVFTSQDHYNWIGDDCQSQCAEFVGTEIQNIQRREEKKTSSVVQTKRLKEINWANGRICFYSSNREDMEHDVKYYLTGDPLQKLDSICVFDANNHSIRRFEFRYGYFGEGDFLTKRLKLERIIDKDNLGNSHSMEYNEKEDFPTKDTKSVDYWGYYNGKVYENPYCMALDSVGSSLNYITFKSFDGAVKYSNEQKTSLGMLSSITLPTGGKETYKYEPNEFVWYDNLEEVKNEETYLDTTIDLLHYGDPNDFLESCMTDSFFVKKETNAKIQVKFYPYGTEQTYPAYEVFSIGPNNFYQDTCDLTHVCRLMEGWHQVKLNKIPDQWKGVVSINIRIKGPIEAHTGKIKGAGLRIASISGGGKTRHFEYGEGTLLVQPVMSYNKALVAIQYQVIVGMNGQPIIYDCDYGNYTVQVSESTIPVSSIANGYTIGYRQVDEVCENLRVQSQFYLKPEDDIQKWSRLKEFINPYIGTEPNFQNGILLKKKTYDGDKCKMQEIMEWDIVQSQWIPAVHLYYGGGGFAYNHSYKVSQNSLRKKTTIQYEGQDSTKTSTTFNYNKYLMPIKQSVWVDGKVYTTQDVYTCDAEDTISKAMTESNLILPKETINLVDGMIVSGNRIDYAFDGTTNTYLPKSIQRLNADKPIHNHSDLQYEEAFQYSRYNAYGKPVEMYKKGTPVVYLWSYGGEYPIAEIVNCTYDKVESALGIDIDQLCNRVVPSETDFARIKALAKDASLQPVQVTTMTYRPMVGVTSISAPTGRTIHFDYDASGRLVQKYYLNGNTKEIIENYEYKYSGN